MKIGAKYLGDEKCEFVVWAPFLDDVVVKTVSPEEKTIPMEKDENGYWKALSKDISAGAQYYYHLEEEVERPDPASNYQPEGVHGPSEVVDHGSFGWDDKEWVGVPLEEMVFYELHIGAFSPEGTFNAVIPRLDELKGLGVNAVEVMPVAQFPGERNWGYDGTYPFAVQNSYGGPEGLKKLVNACHEMGFSVVLDVVYNHLGPEGNYLRDFGPYFTDKYETPWGEAVNFDGAYSDGVRNFFIENALYWFSNFHVDGLRLDAVHTIFDMSAKPFLLELSENVEKFSSERDGKNYLIAENDLNDVKTVKPELFGGLGLDAQWLDDFHHSLHALLTGEDRGYYTDFGEIDHLVKAFREGFVYGWEYSRYRKRRHGSSSENAPAGKFVVFCQNHDQVGNRMLGERLTNLVSFDELKLAAGTVFLSPYIPLLFMGEEYGEESPFLYFVSHSDPDLIESVREGRKKEFEDFNWDEEPPDPQKPETFHKSKIGWGKRNKEKNKIIRKFYKKLIRLRRENPALSNLDKEKLEVTGDSDKKTLFLKRWEQDTQIFSILNFSRKKRNYTLDSINSEGDKVIDSSDKAWNGPGSLSPLTIKKEQEVELRPTSFALYEQRNKDE